MTPANGWMGRFEPLRALPARFADVEALLGAMPLTKSDGSRGLLAHGEFGAAVLKNLQLHRVDSACMHWVLQHDAPQPLT